MFNKLITFGIFGSLLVLLSGCPHLPKSEAEIRRNVVQLESSVGYCSGTQIHTSSGHEYILTAAHCEALAEDGYIKASFDGERAIPRRVIEASSESDLMLLEGLPNRHGLDIAEDNQVGDHLRSFTHGLHLLTHKSQGELIQFSKVPVMVSIVTTDEEAQQCEVKPKNKVIDALFFKVCALYIESIISDLKIHPGSSGGAVVNDVGELAGVAYASGEDFSLIVPVKDVQAFLKPY